ncbi:MAG: hypothetical protein JWQ04_2298 [Pedosphaera sp.]|nr:hypothetical protein [Pedosphaera sp.]
MKTKITFATLAFLSFAVTGTLRADPQLTSWFTTYSGRYARIYTNAASATAGNAVTTWSNGSQTQALPAYNGVQEIDFSSNWIYVRSTGLAGYVMGPWSVGFPNLPSNQKSLFRIPRAPAAATSTTLTGAGTIGVFVDGVAMFNSWDAFYWSGTANTSAMGPTGGYWNRDAFFNEGATFDPGNAHQQQGGTYHYHANPIALRYLLGDHVNYNPVSNVYSESTAPIAKHSPILAWVGDGYPLYGPYGYANATNPASGLRRMISGYVPRNGSNGTDNLNFNGAARTYLPAWALREYAAVGAQSGTTNGPAVSTTYPFGTYMEDYAYLGDLINPNTGQLYKLGTDFDLDEFNGRYCVTPEFPNGTNAYFVSIASNGTPMYPYNIGNAYYGRVTGGSVTTISETVTTNYLGGANLAPALKAPKIANGTVTLTWSATEGGTYLVASTTNLSFWTTNATNISAVLDAGGYTNASPENQKFFRVARTALATYDPVSGSAVISGGGTSVAPGGSAMHGTTNTITITLPNNPPQPPAGNVPTSVTLAGNIIGTSIQKPSQGTVIATFVIPANAPTGAQNIVVTFNPAPTYTMVGAFTIN